MEENSYFCDSCDQYDGFGDDHGGRGDSYSDDDLIHDVKEFESELKYQNQCFKN